MSTTDIVRRQEVHSLLRQAIPERPEKQTKINHIPSNYAQDVIDEAWERLDDTPAASPIHPTLDLVGQAALLRRLCLKIAVNHDVLPREFYIRGVVCMSTEPIGANQSIDVYNGQYNGHPVIVKHPRIYNEGEKDRLIMEFCRESLLWSKLHHANVLPFLGVSQDAFEQSICMVVPFMSRGKILRRMVAQEPEVSAHDVLTEHNFHARVNTWLYEVSLGLAYLHSQGVVHGDLRSGNILIDDDDHVRLTDFGFALIAAATPNAYGSRKGGASYYFMAPELWEPSDFGLVRSRPTKASDVYAFACTCIELYTGKAPWTEGKPTMYRISKRVLRGDRPQRPSTISGSLWAIMEDSWAQQPSARLTSESLSSRLYRIAWSEGDREWSRISKSSKTSDVGPAEASVRIPATLEMHAELQRGVIGHLYKAILGGFKGGEIESNMPHPPQEDIQRTIDIAWDLLDGSSTAVIPTVSPHTHSQILRMLCLKLSTTYKMLPTSFYLEGVTRPNIEPFDTSGSCADIYLGRYRNEDVVLKRPRTQQNSDMMSEPLKHFCRESLLWKQLDHPHVLEFLGIARDICKPICMVLPFMRHGAIRRRINAPEPHLQLTRQSFEEHVNRWLHETALGLQYLHGQGVIHGDLHCGNILVDTEDHVRITDFGFALIANATSGHFASVHGGAAPHFTAPELLGADDSDSDSDESDDSNDSNDSDGLATRPTSASDVYAFACTSVELYGDKLPWNRFDVIRIGKELKKKRRPKRPVSPHGVLMPEPMWDIVEASWKHEPTERLGISTLVQRLDEIVSGKQ